MPVVLRAVGAALASLALAGCAAAGGAAAGGAAAGGAAAGGAAAGGATAAPSPTASVAAPAEAPVDASASASPSAGPRPGSAEEETEAAAPVYPTGIEPVRLEIPRLGVDAPVVDLQLTVDEAEVPGDFDDAGWWVQTRRPGEIGPAVLGGHVDSRSGPAVFYRLSELRPGDRVVVHGEDGATRTFEVDRGVQVDKYDRPAEVFAFGEGRPELRLITCSGDFNPSTGHYDDNFVVFTHQVAASGA